MASGQTPSGRRQHGIGNLGVTPRYAPTVVYIAGASRSGSTLLEEELSARLQAANLGEVRRLPDFYAEDRERILDPESRLCCSCGVAVRDCSYWEEVSKRACIELSSTTLSTGLTPLGRMLFRVLCHTIRPYGVRQLARVIPALRREMEVARRYFLIVDAAGSLAQAPAIIDTSKQVHHFLLLRAYAPERVKFLALIRDGRAVSSSMVRGARRELRRARIKQRSGKDVSDSKALIRSAIAAWRRTMLQMAITKAFLPRRAKYSLRYEDFCVAPERSIAEIACHFSLPRRSDCSIQSRHSIGGSPSRSQSKVQTIRQDERWKNDWTREQEACFGLLDRVINRWLGYRAPSNTDR